MRTLPLLAVLLLSGCAARTRRFIAYRLGGPSAAAVECRQDGAARWCLHHPKGAESDDVVYFFHYATGDERSWDRLGLANAFYAEYRRMKKPAPRVVTVSFGTHWLVTKTPGLRQTVSIDDIEALRRSVEERLGRVGRRYLWGMSLGGYNAATLALARPKPWKAVALSCPALHASSPYEKIAAVDRFPRGAEGREAYTLRLAGEAAWKAENPLALLSSATEPPPFWIEADVDDDFGFFDGARAFEAALRAANARVEFTASPGGHCLIDARAAARFLARAAD